MNTMQNTNPMTNPMQSASCQDLIKPWLVAIKANPNLTKEQITPQIAQLIKSGVSPVDAFSSGREAELLNKIAQLQEIIRAMQINDKNKLSSIGSLSSTPILSDAFISGLSK